MASKPLLLIAGALVAGGLGLVVAGPRISPREPVVAARGLAEPLETQLRDAATMMRARAETLAGLGSLRASVSTDAETVRRQTKDEIDFQPKPGEVITIAQQVAGAEPTVLLVLPAGAEPASGLAKDGLALQIAGKQAGLVEVMTVVPKYVEADRPLRGALAISRALDLAPFARRLDALGVSARLEAGGQRLLLGGRAFPPDEPLTSIPLLGEAGRGVTLVAAIPTRVGGPPLAPIGLGLLALGAIAGLLGARRVAPPSLAQVAMTTTGVGTAETLRPTQVNMSTRSASLSEIGEGSVLDATYEIMSLLGQGGMGAVWRARHLRLPGKQVAVKFLLNEDNDAELLARFRREAEVTSKLGHPNIVGVMDFNVLPSGTPYIVLEYLEGESLSQRIARGPIPLAEALAITRQIASALHAAHKIGVVHRDLKPDNVFLVPSESGAVVAKVLDFGISKMRGNVSVNTQESTLLGTPQYMSPEQANGKNSEVDGRSDLWALGTIVYEMITGTAAFQGESMTTLLVAVLVHPSPSLRGRAGVPEHVAVAIDRSLSKDAASRQPDLPSFIAELTLSPLVTEQRSVVDGT